MGSRVATHTRLSDLRSLPTGVGAAESGCSGACGGRTDDGDTEEASAFDEILRPSRRERRRDWPGDFDQPSPGREMSDENAGTVAQISAPACSQSLAFAERSGRHCASPSVASTGAAPPTSNAH